ncbi:nucleotide sugar transporter SLC35B4 isoform X1 [Cavia porcellus]|uniref:nucleotide sugar transporter SLC35B4 isoform X1 n=1 Tax=Cavia porcellus TaxID=10141 RepID=UPI000C8774BF|nr:UDP-xylose and UDP-N-acetylglucosamine transporter isoform X1 [Cavia porcellus]
MRAAFAVGLVFAGCCSNVIFLELLARKHPGCGNIVTFAQFLFIAVEGFLFEADLGRKPPAIPIRYYAIMVTMFFTVSVVNNYALNLNIAMPLHMIFRSGSLIANMILGIIILKKRYNMLKYLSIALVSVGIFICTFMSAKQVTSQSSVSENDGFQAFAWWLLGIGALTFALLMSARMGIFQETLYKQFGKHSKEALFYNHALPLPGFIFLASDIYDHAVLFSKSAVEGRAVHKSKLPGHQAALKQCVNRTISTSSHRRDSAHHVALPAHECYHSVCVHPGCVHPHDRMCLPHCHACCDSTQVCEPHLFHLIFPEPFHSVALVGYFVCLHWDLNVHRGVEQHRDRKKSATEG